MRKRCFYPIILLAAVAVLLVYVPPEDRKDLTLISPDNEKVKVFIEVADTSEEIRRGLMFRESLNEGHGMLFIFEQEEQLSFWMKNTLIPLDIIFFNAKKEYVSGTTMVPCKKDPCRNYLSDGSAKYGLEVPKGFIKRHGIGEKWTLK